MNLLMTTVNGDGFYNLPETRRSLRSMEKIWRGDRVICSSDLSDTNKIELKSKGWVIFEVPKASLSLIVVDRFKVYWDFLNSNFYKIVMICDAKDVLFQSDVVVFDGCRNWTDWLILADEGKDHNSCDWNTLDQKGFQKSINVTDSFENWRVVNGGFQFGSYSKIKDFCFTVWNGMNMLKPHSTEQAYINYIYNKYLVNDKDTYLSNPAKFSLITTGDAIAKKTANHEWVLKDGLIYNPNLSKPFSIVHQWERTIYRDFILST